MKNNNKVDVPLIFFFFVFLIILFGLYSKFAFKTDSTFSRTLITPTSQKENTILKTLNYTLPITCTYQTKGASISASINSDNSIATSIMQGVSTQKYIIQADCMYSWNAKDTVGTKKCGMGNYVTLGKQLLASGTGSVDSLTSMFQKSTSVSSIDFQAVFKTCRNVGEIKKEVFAIPKGVRFE